MHSYFNDIDFPIGRIIQLENPLPYKLTILAWSLRWEVYTLKHKICTCSTSYWIQSCINYTHLSKYCRFVENLQRWRATEPGSDNEEDGGHLWSPREVRDT